MGGLGDINFVLPHGPLIRLLRRSGFVVEDMIEVYAPEDGPVDVDNVDRHWGRRWPSEEVWKACLVADAAAGGDDDPATPSAT